MFTVKILIESDNWVTSALKHDACNKQANRRYISKLAFEIGLDNSLLVLIFTKFFCFSFQSKDFPMTVDV